MLNEINHNLYFITNQLQANLPILTKIVLLPWLVFILNKLLGNRLLLLGIKPRKSYGLLGIIFAPLLHGNFNHLFFNTIPLAVLSSFILIQGQSYFLLVTCMITVGSGLLIWCFAKPGLHIGASALITGYWGLLVIDTFQAGTITSVILGLISIYYFAGIFFGIFPGKKGVSWEGHLFGLLAGLATNYLLYHNIIGLAV